MEIRRAEIARRSRETDIKISLNIDGRGETEIDTQIPFLNHMLELFAYWGLFDLKIKAKGDIEVDIHHTNEDVGICLGEAFKQALRDKAGIRRIAFSVVPMGEALAEVSVDISGRPFLRLNPQLAFASRSDKERSGYNFEDAKHFLQSFVNNCGLDLHINLKTSADLHHTLEAMFKALGIALDGATQIDPRRKGVPSTKGRI
ncbi:MAG: imidazoleglycerol-phosphate dehydratase HisB [Candidatus Omnitrophota bacterium]|nr:MAG: imidazoleglycerol-phosphate dehydratase HisB [Candidatus Omnitrophota bacterium]